MKLMWTIVTLAGLAALVGLAAPRFAQETTSDAPTSTAQDALRIVHHSIGIGVQLVDPGRGLPRAIRIVDLDPLTVSGLKDDIAPDAATLELGGGASIPFYRDADGVLTLALPPGLIQSGDDPRLSIRSGDSVVWELGLRAIAF